MENTPKAQAMPDNSGDTPNQKATEVSPKEVNPFIAPVKKDEMATAVPDPEEMEEGTTLPESAEEKAERNKTK
jgi:hypothetical protein